MFNKTASSQLNNISLFSKRKYRLEKINYRILLFVSLISIVSVVLITIFIFINGLPAFKGVSLSEFLFSTNWSPSAANPHYGIFSFIVTSFYMTILSLLITMPISIATSLYISFFAKNLVLKILKSAIELLSGIPSVIYGLFGIVIIVPFIRNSFGLNGYSLLSGSIVLAIMIIPIIVTICTSAFSSIPKSIIEASYALGSTKWQTIYKVILPSAKSGILTAFVLAANRAIGETTAVLMVAGNAPLFPTSLLGMSRTLTMNIITDMSYAQGLHMQVLFATALILLVFVIIIDIFAIYLVKKMSKGVFGYEL